MYIRVQSAYSKLFGKLRREVLRPNTSWKVIHLVSFISNDLFKSLVGKFPVFWAVAYFFLKILDSRCLFYIVNFEKLHHFYRYFCNTWIFIFEASINNILRLKKGIIVGTNTKYCHYSFILDFILLKCCLKFSAKN